MDFTLSPFLFQIGDFGLRYYSLMYLLGLAICYFWLTRVSKYDRSQVADFCLYGFLVVVIGARVGYVLFYQPQWLWTDFWEVFKIWNGGLSFHGGALAIPIWMWVYGKRQGWNFWKFSDALVVPAMLALSFGRVGNFLNGELWGRVTDVPWCFNVLGWEGCRHPSQLYEASIYLFLFLVFAGLSSKKPRLGTMSALFLICYGVGRSTVEMLWREPSWVFGGLTAGTWLSLPMVLIGIVLLLRTKK